MSNIEAILAPANLPRSLAEVLDAAQDNWPRRDKYTPSPADWRDEIFCFLLPDRFSDGKEQPGKLLKFDLSTAEGIGQIRTLRGHDWKWNEWQQSGAERFQGGTLKGIRSKLPYLAGLGVTTIWIAPIFRQRVEENIYHTISGDSSIIRKRRNGE